MPITTPVVGTYVSFTIESDGDGDGDSIWRYAIDADDPDVDGLQENEEGIDEFEVTATDGATLEIRFTINGVNDPSTWSGDDAGAITEDADPNTVSGMLTVFDPDDSVRVEAESHNGTYGRFRVDHNGEWTYTLENARDATNALDSGATGTPEVFTVNASDGNARDVTITVTGANDDTIFGGDLTGSIDEDDDPNTASGTMTIDDPDTGGVDTVVALNNRAPDDGPGYGTFTIDANGAWTYTLDNTDALDSGDTVTETFTVTAADGQVQVITITVTGADDESVIAGDTAGAVTEAGGENNGGIGNPTATGSLSISDVDGDDTPTIRAQTITGVYGELVVDADGNWTYTLDDDDPQTQALGGNDPDEAEDTFAVEASDDNTVTVAITVTGADDVATFSGVNTGAVTENANNNTARGSYTIRDVDLDDDATWEPQVDADGTYGTFSIDRDGDWTYTLDNARDATNALGSATAPTGTDTFTVSSAHAGDD